MLSLERCLELRNQFIDFAENKELKKELKKEAERENQGKTDERFTEWFLFEKIFSDTSTPVDNFAETLENDDEKEYVKSWKKFVFSIFKPKKMDNENYTLLNMVNNQKYIVNKKSIEKELVIGDYFIARLIPFQKEYLFTNIFHKLKVNTNDSIYTTVAQFELDFPFASFIDNENKMELSYRIQRLEHEDFVDYFGGDEIIVEGNEIPNKLHEFYHYRYFQKKERNTGKTIAKIFREKYGSFPDLPLIELPEQILSLGEVGIVYDIVEGLNFLPWYGIFTEIFKSNDFREIPGYKKCVMEYLKSDTISTLPFNRVLKKYPQNASEVFKDVLNKKKFQLPDDFNKLMEKYKKFISEKIMEPTVIPMPERTKALLRTKKPEEYSTIHFSEGPNHYKDVYGLYQIE